LQILLKLELKYATHEGLRRMFGLEKDEAAGCWKELRNEGLCSLYALQNTTIVMKWMCSMHGRGGIRV
jgi:hypothetical protein